MLLNEVLIQWFGMNPGQTEIMESYVNDADSHSWLRNTKLSLQQV